MRTCPRCGSHLMLREGDNGDFMACPKFPACRYTESLPDGVWSKGDHGTLSLELRPDNINYCKECNHTGLLPFIKKGRVIPNAFIDCKCRVVDEPYHYLNIVTDDFDFPVSKDFREHTFQQFGRPWERRYETYEPEEERLPEEPPPAPQPWDQRQQNQIDLARAEVRSLGYKVAALTGEKPKQEKAAYKGLVVKEGK